MPLQKHLIRNSPSQIIFQSSKIPRRRSLSKHSLRNSIDSFIQSQKKPTRNQISFNKCVHSNTNKTSQKIVQNDFSVLRTPKSAKKRRSESFSKKQSSFQDCVIEESRSKKYIINEPKCSESSKGVASSQGKQKSGISSFHSKTLSNQTLLNAVNGKGPLRSNLKKKGQKYIKGNARVGGIDKSFCVNRCQKSSNTTHANNSSHMELQRQLNRNQQMLTLQKVSCFNSKELQLLRFSHTKIISKIQADLESLVAQVGYQKGESLKKLSNDYQRIICDLFQTLKQREEKTALPKFSQSNKTQDQPQHDDSTDNTSDSQFTQQNHSPENDLSNHQLEQYPQTKTSIFSPVQKPSQDTFSAKSLIKKLNLTNLKQTFQVRDYHEEFLDMKQDFSESWKRQLNKQKKF